MNNKMIYSGTTRWKWFGKLNGHQALRATRILRGTGNVLGAVGISLSYYQMKNGQISERKGIMDIGMGVVGYLGPVGFVQSMIYFAVDTVFPGVWEEALNQVLKSDWSSYNY